MRESGKMCTGRRCRIVVCAGLSLAVWGIASADGSTDVNGTISASATWDLAGSPYVLSGNVTVRRVSGGTPTLTIDPGVEVQLQGHQLQIGYRYSSSSYPAVLDASGATFEGGGTLLLYEGGGNAVSNCTFDGAELRFGQYASGTVTNSTLSTLICQGGTWTVTGGSVTDGNISGTAGTLNLDDVSVEGSGTYGVSFSNTAGAITECTISGYDYPFLLCGGEHSLAGNDVSGCTNEAIATSGNMNRSTTWTSSWGMAFALVGDLNVRKSNYGVPILTMEPGVQVELNGHQMQVGYRYSTTNYEAVLSADGVAFGENGTVYLYDGGGNEIDSCIFNGTGLKLGQYASGTITDSTLTNLVCQGGTWTVTGGSVTEGNISGTAGTLSLDDIDVAGAGTYGISLANTAGNITDCTISGYDYPFLLCGGEHSLSGNDVSGCANQMIATSGTMNRSTTWGSAWGLPLILVGDLNVRKSSYGVPTLTVEPGMVVDLNGHQIQVGYRYSSTNYEAVLLANGVTFEGGGTLWLYDGSPSTLENCTLDLVTLKLGQYASGAIDTSDLGAVNCQGGTWTITGGNVTTNGVVATSGTLNMLGVDVHGSGTYGISLANTDADIQNCTISGYDYPFMLCGGSHTLAGNDVSGCVNQAIAMSGNLNRSTTWHSGWTLPLMLVGDLNVRKSSYGTPTLTIEPGVTLVMNGHQMQVGYRYSSSDYQATLNASGATFEGGGALWLYDGGPNALENCTFDLVSVKMGQYASGTVNTSDLAGVNCQGGTWTITGGNVTTNGVVATGGTLNMSGVDIHGSGSYGVSLTNANGDVQGCAISGYDYPFQLCGGDHILLSNDTSGCVYQGIAVSGYMYTNTTWKSVWGLPITLEGDVHVRYQGSGGSYPTLTIEPGVDVRMDGRMIQVGYYYGGYSPRSYPGTILADGAVFSEGGQIYIYTGSGENQLANCILDGTELRLGDRASGSVTNSTLAKVSSSGGTWSLTGGEVTTNGISGTGGTLDLYGVDVLGSGQYGISLANTDSDVTDCTVSGYTYPLMLCGGEHTLWNNDLSGCDNAAIAVAGNMYRNATWRSSWGLPFVLTAAVSVRDQDGGAGNPVLTIEPGVNVNLAGYQLQIGYYYGGYSPTAYKGTLLADDTTFAGGGSVYLYTGGPDELDGCDMNSTQLRLGRYASGTILNSAIADLNGSGGTWSIACGSVGTISLHSDTNPSFWDNDFTFATLSTSGDSAKTFDLENNWWGTTDVGEIADRITDCDDDSNRPCVDFVPFLDGTPSGCAPPAPPSGDGIEVGMLRVNGDSIVQLGDSRWRVSGNVWLNDLLRMTGMVQVNTATMMVYGDGEIWLDGVLGLGNVEIYDGQWEFDAREAATTTINKALAGFKAVGMDVEVTDISIQPMGVRIQGHVIMPELLNGAELRIEGDEYIQLTRTGGLEWSGATVTIDDTGDLAFMGVPFNANSVVLHVAPDEVQVRGILELPGLLGGTTIDLSTESNHLTITEVGGQPEVEVVGTLSMEGPIVVGPGFSIEDVDFTLDTVEAILEGNGTLNVPAGFGIVAGIGFRDGYFNYVQAGASSMGIVVIYGPPPAAAPVVYWQDVSGFVDELAPGPPPVVLGGAMAFTAGPQVGAYYLARLELAAEYDTGGRFTGMGQVLLGGGDEPFEFASATIVIDKVYGLYIEGHLSYIGIVDVNGALRIDLYNNMQGSLVGTIHLPGWLGGMDLAETTMYAQYYDDADDTNDYFIAAVRAIFGFESAVRIDIHTGEVDWHADMDLIHEVDVPPGLRGSLPVIFDLPAGVEGTLFRAEWNDGDTDAYLIRPDDTLITPSNVDQFDDVRYFKNADDRMAMFAVSTPEAGQWQVDLATSNGIGGYRLQQLNTTTRPVISVLEPSVDTSAAIVNITWTDADSDSDAQVSLYYDTNRSGADGTEIISGLSEDSSTNAFAWDTAGVAAGTYYIYAQIDDGLSPPSIDYSLGRVFVTDPAAPAAPTALAVAPGDQPGELILSWMPPAGEVHHHVVGLNADAAGEGYAELVAATEEDTTTLTGLTPGEQYRVSVAAVDSDNRIGEFSDPVVLTVTDPLNHVPVFDGTVASRATVGVLYESWVLASDLDEDDIGYALAGSPAGMNVSTSGLIEWTPSSDQIGDHTFSLLLDDGHSGTNGLAVTVHVVDTNGINRAPEILSHAPALVAPATTFVYQVEASDPDAGDSLFYELLAAPVGASVSPAGLVEYGVPAGSGRYEFLLRVYDEHGLYDVRRFAVQADADAPTVYVADWGVINAAAADALAVEAHPTPDATGLVEYRLDVDGVPGDWQTSPTWSISSLSPNTAYGLRVEARDAAPGRNASGWSNVLTAHTLCDAPPAPTLMLAEETVLSLLLSCGTNPANTLLALWNESASAWVGLDGAASPTEVWADAASWDTAAVPDLAVDTTYHFRTKAKNGDDIETSLSDVLIAKTLAPSSMALIDASTNGIYESAVGSMSSQVTVTAEFVSDPYENATYTFNWIAVTHSVTGERMRLVSGGGPDDATATFAAPELPATDPAPYEVQCVITGGDHGNYVFGSVGVTVFRLGDSEPDGDVDLDDFVRLSGCLSGPSGEPALPHCTAFRFDDDDDVDLGDFAKFQGVFGD